uniref:Uncharacterized protein n=1 Tax=Arundo donax TaxID=35708 RepID=A0A0A9ER77_ARUDO
MLPALRPRRWRSRHPQLERTTTVAGGDRTLADLLVSADEMPYDPLCSSPDAPLLKQTSKNLGLALAVRDSIWILALLLLF